MRRLALLFVLLACALPVHADEDAGAALLESGAVFVEASLEPTEGAVVGQRVSVQLHLGTRNWFTGAPTLPDPEIEGAIVRRFGNQAVNASDNRDGESYAVQTWTWWVYPRRAGTFEVPALDVLVRTVDDERAKVEVRARTQPLRFEVSLPPSAAGDEVLTTRAFVLEQTLDPEPDGLKVGDALRRTLTMRADDVPGMLIPPVPLQAPEGLRPYPDAPRVEDEYDRGTLQGIRVQSTSYVLEREGEFLLPEVRLRWWNLKSQAWEEAVAEAVALSVAANPDAVLGTGTPDDEAPASDRAEGGLSAGRIATLLGVLLLLGLGFVFTKRRLPMWKQELAAARKRRWDSEPAAFGRFEEACRTNDPRQARDALRAWLDRAASPSITFEAFAESQGDEALSHELEHLASTLYGAAAPPSPWTGAALAQAVAHRRERMQSSGHPDRAARRSLNPSGPLTRT